MRKIFLSLLAFCFVTAGTVFSAPTPAAQAATPASAAQAPLIIIGVVDSNKIMNESPKAKACQEQLNQAGNELAKRLESEKPNLTPAQFSQKQEAYYTKYLQIKQDLQLQVEASINMAIAQVAKEKNLYLVVYKSGVALGGADITADVISKMR